MSGVIPAEIGLMVDLVVLNFDEGAFSGTIPSELFGLAHLQETDLEANKLTGTTEIGLLTGLMDLRIPHWKSSHGNVVVDRTATT